MITPEYLEEVTRATENATANIDTYLIKRIAERIEKTFYVDGEVRFIPATMHDFHKLLQSGLLMDDIGRLLTVASADISDEVAKAFADATNEIMAYHNKVLEDALGTTGLELSDEAFTQVPEGINPKTGLPKEMNITPTEARKIETAYKRTNGTIHNLTQTTVTQANQAYIRACDSAYMKIQAGVSPNTAICEAIKELAREGVTVVDYATGHTDKMEVAVARAVRTGVNQANAQTILQRCAELGVGYVKVSEHLGARVTKAGDYTSHADWQGKVYKLDFDKPELAEFKAYYKDPRGKLSFLDKVRDKLKEVKYKNKYPDFVEVCGYGKPLGICGINCRHTFHAYFPSNEPNVSKIDKEANEEYYKKTQKARAMERKIRYTKRMIEALKPLNTDEAKQELKRYKQLLEVQDKAYRDYLRANNITGQNWRTRIN